MKRALCTAILVCLLLASSVAQEEDRPLWKKDATTAGLDKAVIDQLERDGLVITNEAFRQCFTPYILGKLPPFITSDVLLNAFHVLLEESIRRRELTSIQPLHEILQKMLAELPKAREFMKKDPEAFDAGHKRARLILAVGLRLLGAEPELPEEESAIVTKEVERIEAATARLRPEWLGKSDAGFMAIDYKRFKPAGFYAGNARLERYFRAVQWLQAVPMRVDDDIELATAILLSDAFYLAHRYNTPSEQLEKYADLLGESDDIPISAVVWLGDNLEQSRQKIAEKHKPRVNDLDRLPENEDAPVPQQSFRVIPGYRLAESPLLQMTGALPGREHASGLDVAAMLGSGIAREQTSEGALKLIDGYEADLDSSFHARYLGALSRLNREEPDAPEVFRSKPWRVKSCNTQLAGWAQMRHTWALHAKPVVYLRLETDQHHGFVEPAPEFFSALAVLCDEILDYMNERRAFEPDVFEYARLLREFARLGREKNFGYTPDGDAKDLTRAEWDDLDRAEWVADILWLDVGTPWEDAEGGKKLIKRLDETAEQLEKGEYTNHERLENCARWMKDDLDAQWEELTKLLRRCESLAHKQLRKADFNDDDKKFLQDFGKRIGGVMFYAGNSWLIPRDDAPRVAEIGWNAETDTRMHVGVCRPRAIYVLYPWDGELVLCQGAVLPYYEFTDQTRLTDTEWIAHLDSDQRPKTPAWLTSILAKGGLSKPVPKDD